ncbi:uncharacterized protein LOC143036829 [Oratosquilla oratoria]|uniref:uncharacterized protein LOC143036829 n=1 Tax=Oratosquilla oratoria TaxID=337810 RepID=UPI003F771B01
MATVNAEDQEKIDTPGNGEQRKRLSTENIESQSDIPKKITTQLHQNTSNEKISKENEDGKLCNVNRGKDSGKTNVTFKEVAPEVKTFGDKPSGTIHKDSKDTSLEAEKQISSELKKELDKAKRRFSSIGRGRRSTMGRRSLCVNVEPMISMEDQINNIRADLPKASKVCHLLDIALRESLRRLVEACPSKADCMTDLRRELLTASEKIAGEISFKIAGQRLTLDKPLSERKVEKENPAQNQNLIAAYKKKTEILKEELNEWKTMMKGRKHLCAVAEREFVEAKSGETKIDEEQVKLSALQSNILASRPNYQQYIQELQTAREKTLLTLHKVEHVSEVVSKFITVTEARHESCYNAIERKCFGHMKHDCKEMLQSLAKITSFKDSCQMQDATKVPDVSLRKEMQCNPEVSEVNSFQSDVTSSLLSL